MIERYDIYRQWLDTRGLRVTPQRIAVLRALDEKHDHLTIEEIMQHVQAMLPAIAPATVYRVLDQLSKAGVISESRLADRQVYELMGELPHSHLLCACCGHSIAIEYEDLAALYRSFAERYGFIAHPQHLVFAGICQACIPEKA
jgi:Fe2+ or Zn2+ uptake regulation protein